MCVWGGCWPRLLLRLLLNVPAVDATWSVSVACDSVETLADNRDAVSPLK